MGDLPIPRMDWDSPDIITTFQIFKQKCNLYFSVKGVKKEKEVDYILLFSGEHGLKLYNSWGLQAEERTSTVIWNRFETHIEPKTNFRVARIYLREYQQGPDEAIDDFVARCRLQANKCSFSDTEKNNRILDQVIAGVVHPKLQMELLGKNSDFTLDEALNLGRTFEASIRHLKSVTDLKTNDNPSINHIKEEPGTSRIACRNCGRIHSFKHRRSCPAFGSRCSACNKFNHWKEMCQSSYHERSYTSRPMKTPRNQPNYFRRIQSSERNNVQNVNEVVREIQPSTSDNDNTLDEFNTLHISVIDQEQRQPDEVFAEIQLALKEFRTLVKLSAKVDTGAQGNTMPLRIFKQLFPSKIEQNGLPCANSTLTRKTILTAYNGTKIDHFGVIRVPTRYKGNWIDTEFFVVNNYGTSIIGLPTARDLKLITLHCTINNKKDIYLALLNWRTTPVNHIVHSPAQLLYMRRIRGTLPNHIVNQQSKRDTIAESFQQRQDYMKEYYDRNAEDLHPLYDGQAVLVQDPNTKVWSSARIIRQAQEPRSYIIQTSNGSILRRNRVHLRDINPTPQGDEKSDHIVEQNNICQPPARSDDAIPGKYTRSGREVKKPIRLDL